MGKKRAELAYERGRLLERIQYQRRELARELLPLQSMAQKGDRWAAIVADLIGVVRQSPLTFGSVAIALAVLKPRMAWRLAKRGFFIWRGWRAVQQWQPAMLQQFLRRFV